MEALVPSVAASVFRSVQTCHVTMSTGVLKTMDQQFKERIQVYTLKDTVEK